MVNTIFLVVSLLLISQGEVQAASDPWINCNLKNGQGCRSNDYFTVTDTGIGRSGNSCNKTYEVKATLSGGYDRLYCYFMTTSPTGNIYSISHNPSSFKRNAPLVTERSSLTEFSMKRPQQTVLGNERWLQHDLHSTGTSDVVYQLDDEKILYYSTHRDYFHWMGHSGLFIPSNTPLYFGLNRLHGRQAYGAGLCQFYCGLLNARSDARVAGRGSANDFRQHIPPRPPSL